MKVLVAALVAAALTGCLTHLEPSDVPLVPVRTSLTVHGDDRFSPEERRSIERASVSWSLFTNGRTRVQIFWDVSEQNYMNISLPMIYRSNASELTGSQGGKTTCGINGCIVRLIPETCNMYSSLETCAKHEFGHLFGLEHFTDIQGQVMSTCAPGQHHCGPSGVFGPADLRECIRVGVCDRPKDVTTVTMTVDPAIPQVEPEYPR